MNEWITDELTGLGTAENTHRGRKWEIFFVEIFSRECKVEAPWLTNAAMGPCQLRGGPLGRSWNAARSSSSNAATSRFASASAPTTKTCRFFFRVRGHEVILSDRDRPSRRNHSPFAPSPLCGILAGVLVPCPSCTRSALSAPNNHFFFGLNEADLCLSVELSKAGTAARPLGGSTSPAGPARSMLSCSSCPGCTRAEADQLLENSVDAEVKGR